MLLNASHEITNCGLPQHIQERYVRYKQGNRAIVAWMTRYGPEKFKGRKTLPIKQLIALGKFLCDKIQEIGTLPADVDYYFKDVIKERAYLSQHFRVHRDRCEKDITDTINHEHFTESLKQIHQILLTAGKPSSRTTIEHTKQRSTSSRSSTSSISEIKNSFSHLLATGASTQEESDASEDDALSITDTDATSACSHSPLEDDSCVFENNDETADFLDTEGQVGVAVESLIFLDNIKHIAEAVKLCWIKAGNGAASFAAMSAYTNVLLVKAATHVRVFHQNEPCLLSIWDIKQRLDSLSCNDHQHVGEIQQGSNEILEALAEIHLALCEPDVELTDVPSSKTHLGASTPSCADITKRETTQPLIQRLLLDLTAIQRDPQISKLTFDGLSCIEGAGIFPRGCWDSTKILTTSVLLYLLSVSQCAYSSVLPQPSRIALPRISALKMSNEALSSIRAFLDDKSIFPCQCINTLGYRVAQLKVDLEAFSKYKCWSALMQSPLIAGNHVLEILDLCSYYGMHLFHYRQYVAAVLHTYQALVQLKAMKTIPILEEACDLFAPVLYATGIRPETGFIATWLRYIGARLKFKKGKNHQNHKDTWCMSVPTHAAARSAGLNIDGKDNETQIQAKFDYGTIDHVIRLKRGGWALQGDAAELLDRELYASSSAQTMHAESSETCVAPPRAQKARRNKHKRSKSCQVDTDAPGSMCDTCLKLDHTFGACFTADCSDGRKLPSSRINLLSFFHSMTKVVSGISDTTHAVGDKETSSSSKDSGKGQMCLCFVQTILRGADRILDARKRSGIDSKGAVWSKNEKECIECYKEHLMKMLEDAQVVDGSGGMWLWSGI